VYLLVLKIFLVSFSPTLRTFRFGFILNLIERYIYALCTCYLGEHEHVQKLQKK